MSVIPVSTIQTIPAYATQTVPIYNNAIAPSLNYGASAPLLSNTTNYGTTSVPSSFIQVPVTNPVKPTESVISLAHSQLSIPTTPSIIPTAPLYTQPRGGLKPLLFHASNIPLSAVQIRPNYVNNYPIDENDPRRFPRYCVFTLPVVGNNYAAGARTQVAHVC